MTTEVFEAERPRLVALAARVLADGAEAEDVVQQAWLRWHGTDAHIDNLPAWLTTVTSRLCLDRLRVRRPVLVDDAGALPEDPVGTRDPADEAVLTGEVGAALALVLDRLSPQERVAFVLHDSFAVEFPTIAEVLDTSPAAARKLASRARAKLRPPAVDVSMADWEVVDAFMAAARGGEFDRLLALLAPDVVVTADDAAVLAGTPERIVGRSAVADFFDGSAHAALPVLCEGRPGYAWFHRGDAAVAFDFTVAGGVVTGLVFRAEPDALAGVVRREGADARA
ncbi:sigma-70 family RNA polymerase sigma factor [Nocardioides marinus]|uniref:RNA polymerase sigma-70 factor (ECF subfamily) n=1 Tax=Nocardioides marinus TaxID=374514 RepID=A0A7Y9YGR6_9ACTN|nr:RNA polymerase sigma-70 factor (ECF subfamily) [Nocardioides marinus]